MGLTNDESNLLKKLLKKKDEPDAAPIGRSVNVSVDLGDEKQVKAAHKLGLLSGLFDSDDDDDKNGDGNDDDDDADDGPTRRGYFNQ